MITFLYLVGALVFMLEVAWPNFGLDPLQIVFLIIATAVWPVAYPLMVLWFVWKG